MAAQVAKFHLTSSDAKENGTVSKDGAKHQPE